MAKVLAKELDPYKLMFIEEPVLSENVEALRDIVNQTSTPIALGERLYSRWDFKRILAGGYVDIIQPDASHAGGITECRKIASMAEAYDVGARAALPARARSRWRPACRSTRSATTRSSRSRASASTTTRATTCSTTCANPEVFKYEDGFVAIPQGPGLGIEVDEEKVRETAAGRPSLAQSGLASRGRQRRRVVILSGRGLAPDFSRPVSRARDSSARRARPRRNTSRSRT